MFAVLFLSSLAALLLVYICIPAVWYALMAGDDSLDAHESGLMVVASRNPFRETGPPANMAKLILLRHKIQTTNKKRRNSSSHSRQASRTYTVASPRAPKNTWMRFGRPFTGKQFH